MQVHETNKIDVGKLVIGGDDSVSIWQKANMIFCVLYDRQYLFVLTHIDKNYKMEVVNFYSV